MPTFNNTITGPQNENAIEGASINGRGVVGSSETNYGMRAHSKKSAGLRGSSDEGRGVEGWSTNAEGVVGISRKGHGVSGQTEGGTGVVGTSKSGIGVYGESAGKEGVLGVSRTGHAGVVGINESPDPGLAPPLRSGGGSGGWFESNHGEGVHGWSKNASHGGVVGVNSGGGPAVFGTSENGVGVFGTSTNLVGVHGETKSNSHAAVAGIQLNRRSTGAGIYGEHRGTGPAGFFRSQAGAGLHGETNSDFFAAVAGIQLNESSTGAGIYGEHRGNGPAGFFKGKVVVEGDIDLVGADCAEDFDVMNPTSDPELLSPGTVMVIGSGGTLRPSEGAYDKRVAGVVSGAGGYKPGIVLDKQDAGNGRLPIALLGKVFCKVDAQDAPIEVGDLLTTSTTPGHAMKAADPTRAFGTVLGKALRPLEEGRGLVPILVTLQ